MGRFPGSVVGFLAGGVLAFGAGIGLPEIVPISQSEGAYMMSVMFFWVPVGAIAGAIAGALMAGRSPGQ